MTNVPVLSVASKSGGAPPHSKTQAESPHPEWPPRFGVRQCSAALERTIHYCLVIAIAATRIELESNAASVATGRIVTATPKLRTGTKTATNCSLYHRAVARGAIRCFERWPVGSCMNRQSDSSRDPAHQLAQDDHPATEKDNYRPGLPDQSVDELVQLHTGHAQICCEFRATLVRRLFAKAWR